MEKLRLKKRLVSIVLFYDYKGNILIQDRRKISKHGEEYGFFGGKIEKGETAKQALKREIKEELNFDITNFKLFKNYKQIIPEFNQDVERWVFLSPIPNLNKINCKEGNPVVMNFIDSFNLKMVPGDIELLKEIYQYTKSII